MNSIIRRGTAVGLTVAVCALIAGCDDSYLDQSSARSQQPISSATLAKMEALDTTPSSPTVIRTYKKEAELEIWKMKSNGEYALLKTYPMCRWSGQLGPKKREGDMQVPEGFYSIAPGQMNPNSHYYLAFNVGYPNAYDRAYGRTGGSVMVHGVCSSAGCFSMTDEQVADIYAIARDSFAGGQREIQLQSYPFHMTAQNMAKFRLDPNIDFWKNLKDGSDHFEVTKNEPSVLVCGKHYVFDATTKDEVSGSEACPALKRDPNVEAQVAEKANEDEAKVAELAATGVKPIRLVYADGGQNPAFTGYKDVSDPEALASGPQEIVLNDRAKPVSAAVKVAVADADKKRVASAAPAPVEAPAAQPASTTVAAASTPNQPAGMLGGVTGGAKNVQKWLHLGGQDAAPPPIAAAATDPDQQVPASPLPPQRDNVHLASLHTPPTPPTRRNSAEAPADASDSEPATGVAAVRMIALTRETRSPLIPDPSREAGKEARGFLGVSQRSSWHDDWRAVPRPYVNETASVFRLFAIGVAQVQCAPVHIKRKAFIAERGLERGRRSKAPDRGLTGAARAANPPMTDQSLDHERGSGQNDRRLAGAATDETGQRQDRRKSHDQREGGQRRNVSSEQSAFERRAQSSASGGGFGFGRRKRKSVGPERIGEPIRRHGSPGAFATKARACSPSANSAVKSS